MAFLMGSPLKVVAFPASFLPPLTSKKPAMVVKCYTRNERDEARVKSELATCHTKFHRLLSKGEIPKADRVLEDKMKEYDIPLTPEVKRLVKQSEGTFKTRVYDMYAEIQKKKAFKVKNGVKLMWSRSRKRNRKQKIPPKEDKKEDAGGEEGGEIPEALEDKMKEYAIPLTPEVKLLVNQKSPPKEAKKEDAGGESGAGGGGWWRRRRGNAGGRGHWKTQGWRKRETNAANVVVNINMPLSMEGTVSVENLKSGMNIHITMQEKAAAASVEKAAASMENAAIEEKAASEA